MYFSYFSKRLYDLSGDKTETLVTDLFNRIKVREKIKDQLVLYSTYDVVDGETPESLSYKYYGDTAFYWVILLINNVMDRYYDWPLTVEQFETYLKKKYTNPDGVHHYEITQSSGKTSSEGPSDYDHLIQVNSTTANAVSITNREYEQRVQDQKRQIKILNRIYLTTFIEEFETTIRK